MGTQKMKRMPRPDDAEAFVKEVGLSHDHVADEDAESFGEEFVATATSGENAFEDARDEVVDEEYGGPYLQIRPLVEEEDVEPS